MDPIVKELILPFLPSVLTIIGWWIVYSRDNTSKKNAIHNKRVEAALKLIDKILDDAKRAYSLSGSENETENIEALLMSNFKKLSTIIQLIMKEYSGAEKQSLGTAFLDYKKIITGGQFGSKTRLPISSSNQLYVSFDTIYNDLYIELEKSYLV